MAGVLLPDEDDDGSRWLRGIWLVQPLVSSGWLKRDAMRLDDCPGVGSALAGAGTAVMVVPMTWNKNDRNQ